MLEVGGGQDSGSPVLTINVAPGVPMRCEACRYALC